MSSPAGDATRGMDRAAELLDDLGKLREQLKEVETDHRQNYVSQTSSTELDSDDEADVGTSESVPPRGLDVRRRINVLIIEDEPFQSRLTAQILKCW